MHGPDPSYYRAMEEDLDARLQSEKACGEEVSTYRELTGRTPGERFVRKSAEEREADRLAWLEENENQLALLQDPVTRLPIRPAPVPRRDAA